MIAFAFLLISFNFVLFAINNKIQRELISDVYELQRKMAYLDFEISMLKSVDRLRREKEIIDMEASSNE